MKKVFIVLALLFTLCFAACSTPGTALAYPEPLVASETSVFIGSGLKYAAARNSAIDKAAAEGYTRIVAEVVEVEGFANMIQVTLVMLK